VATFVLVHGSGHGGWCWRRVVPLLTAAGHRVLTPTLTGLGDRAHLLSRSTDLDLHIADVVSVLEHERIHDAVLVGHSYGGMVVTGAADRVGHRVAHLVYLDAAIPRDGESVVDLVPHAVSSLKAGVRVVDGVELVGFPDDGPPPALGLSDPEDVAWVGSMLTPHPWATMVAPIRLTGGAAVEAIPRTVLLTPAHPGIAEDRLASARSAGRFHETGLPHDMMVTHPAETAKVLLDAVPR